MPLVLGQDQWASVLGARTDVLVISILSLGGRNEEVELLLERGVLKVGERFLAMLMATTLIAPRDELGLIRLPSFQRAGQVAVR